MHAEHRFVSCKFTRVFILSVHYSLRNSIKHNYITSWFANVTAFYSFTVARFNIVSCPFIASWYILRILPHKVYFITNGRKALTLCQKKHIRWETLSGLPVLSSVTIIANTVCAIFTHSRSCVVFYHITFVSITIITAMNSG